VSDGYVVAIDAGTGSCRSIVFDGAGAQVASSSCEWSHPPEPGVSGSHAFDTARNWTLIAECVRRSLQRARLRADAIAAVSVSSMREGVVLYDKAGRELWACPNVDGRAGAEAAELVASGAAKRIYEIAGDWVAITAPARLRWLARHEPDLFARVDSMGMLSDWIIYRLTGRHVTEPSAASSSAMFDLRARTWSAELVELCGLDPDAMPEVVDSGTVVGDVSAVAGPEAGLAPGTPVVAGGADTQLALLGAGSNEHGRFTIVGGTFWQHTAILDHALIDPGGRLRTLCHVLPDRWMIEGIGFLSGLTLRWFRDAFCDGEVAEAARRGLDPYVVMEELAAAAPPGSGGVVGIFSNLMNAQHWIHAAPSLVGFDITDPERSGRRECIRAIEECAAYVARGHLDICADLLGSRPNEVVFTGGASSGALWRQIVADVLDVTVLVPVVRESTSLGAALLAGTAVGLHPDLDTAIARAVTFEEPLAPDPARADAYRELYGSWRALYDASLAISEQGLAKPLWKAAGS
jgi:autoinducer 2 (AI-2) kinase